jgi:hypothetical protein
MIIYIGIDDTDTLKTQGTGHLARVIAENLSQEFRFHGVTRHQLLVDPRIPYTAQNSSAAILIEGEDIHLDALKGRVREIMMANFNLGSDPWLCVAINIPQEIIDYGQRVQREVIPQQEARDLAKAHNIYLEGLGGDENGVIGALAAVGLAAQENDGRYVMIGSVRELKGRQPVSRLLAAGITSVLNLDGEPVTEGKVRAFKLRPARRGGQPVLFVEKKGKLWVERRPGGNREHKIVKRLKKFSFLKPLFPGK